jgi:hypothetical protein
MARVPGSDIKETINGILITQATLIIQLSEAHKIIPKKKIK